MYAHMLRLSAGAALLSIAALCSAEPVRIDHHLRSIPENMVFGYFSADTPPVLRIQSGEVVKIDTVSLGGMRDENPEQFFIENGVPLDLPVVQEYIAIKKTVKSTGIRGHMMTGPIYIEGAGPGDTLEVRVLDVASRTPYGINSGRPGSGGIPDAVPRPYQKVIKFDEEKKFGLFSESIKVPLAPFQGVMGVAPVKERGKLSSSPPYTDIGGNFDNKHLGKGATVYLPVQVEGALFQTGDPHAAQGNGEVSITAIESGNTVVMQFILHKGTNLKVCRAETPTHYITMGLDMELNVAMRMAIMETLGFLRERKGLDFFDALSLSSIAVDFEVTQVVDGTKGIHGMIAKSLFVTGEQAYWYDPSSMVGLASADPADLRALAAAKVVSSAR